MFARIRTIGPTRSRRRALDELRALQLKRLKAAVARAAHVPHYQKAICRGRHCARRREKPRRSRQVSFHHQGRSAAELSVRHVRGADERDRAHPRVKRHHRQADGGRLYARRHRHVGDADGALDPRRRRQARRQDAHRLRLRPVHRRLGLSLRRRISRLRGHPGQRRLYRAPGAADLRFRARHHRCDAVLSARDRRRVRSPGHRCAQIVAAHRAARRGAVDRRRCAPRSSAAWVSMRSMSTAFRK